jgi:pentatricopeptide repeat protein
MSNPDSASNFWNLREILKLRRGLNRGFNVRIQRVRNSLDPQVGKCSLASFGSRVSSAKQVANAFGDTLAVPMHQFRRPATVAARHLLRDNQRISAFGRAGDVAAARRVFDTMTQRDVVSWNALLTALWRGGSERPATRRLFEAILARNVISWNSIIAGCLAHGDLDAASAYFARAPRRNVATWNAMLERLFEEMPERNVVSFTTMVDGLARCGEMARAREMFDAMPERNLC